MHNHLSKNLYINTAKLVISKCEHFNYDRLKLAIILL